MHDSGLLQTYMEHQWELLRFLDRRLGSSSLAADIAHDLYLRLRRADGPAAVGNRRAYLFTMASNLAADHQRVEKRREEIRTQADGVVWQHTDERTPERHALARAELAYLEAEVARLEPRCREIFYLHRYQGLSQAAIATQLGVGLTTVYKDLKTVMNALLAARRRFHGKSQDGNAQ